MKTFALLVVMLPLVVLGACGRSEAGDSAAVAADEPALSGTWIGEDGTSFEFAPGGSALWIFQTDAEPDTFRIRYAYDPVPAPNHLDLSGFERGPLAGRTLFCIADLTAGDTLRLDCEPGSSGDARPGAFTTQTQSYRRSE